MAGLRSAAFAGKSFREAKDDWLSSFESAYALEVLRRHDGNISRAARAAGVDRKTFRKLLNRNDEES